MVSLIFAACLAAPADDYAAFRARIEAKQPGQYLVAYSGVPKPPLKEGVEVVIPGYAPGVYQCWKAADGRCLIAEVPADKPASFRRPAAVPIHRSHNCPTCGRAQYVIAGWNRDGTHTHTCSAGHSWRH